MDAELHKDVEGVLELCCEVIQYVHKSRGGELLQDSHWLQPLLELWDGICCLLEGRVKPSTWVSHLLKTAKLFSPEARTAAASDAKVWVLSNRLSAFQGSEKCMAYVQELRMFHDPISNIGCLLSRL